MSLEQSRKDQKLCQKINQANPRAFETAYHLYVDQIYRFMILRLQDKEVAQDLTAEVFLEAWDYVKTKGKQISHLRGFLYKVARSMMIDYIRRQKFAAVPLNENIEIEHRDPGVQEIVGRKLENEELIASIRSLPETHQELLTLRYIEDLSLDEISQITGKNKNAISVGINRAVTALSERVKRIATGSKNVTSTPYPFP